MYLNLFRHFCNDLDFPYNLNLNGKKKLYDINSENSSIIVKEKYSYSIRLLKRV